MNDRAPKTVAVLNRRLDRLRNKCDRQERRIRKLERKVSEYERMLDWSAGR